MIGFMLCEAYCHIDKAVFVLLLCRAVDHHGARSRPPAAHGTNPAACRFEKTVQWLQNPTDIVECVIILLELHTPLGKTL